MDKRLLLAIALSALVVVAYQEYLRIHYPERPRGPRQAAPPTIPTVGAVEPAREPAPEPAPSPHDVLRGPTAPPPVADVEVETATYRASFTTRGGRLVSLRLKEYRTAIDPKSPPLELVSPGMDDFPLGVSLRGDETWTDRQLVYEASAREVHVQSGETATVVLDGALEGGGRVQKRLEFRGDRYDFAVTVAISGATRTFREASLSWLRNPSLEHADYKYEGVEGLVGRKLVKVTPAELVKGRVLPEPHPAAAAATTVAWAGYADTYFLSAIAPSDDGPARMWAKQEPSGTVLTELLLPAGKIADGLGFTVYAGPKDIDVLASAGHHLARSVELGWFEFVAEPMLHVLKIFHRATGNYGIDIILVTVLIKVLFVPLTHKSYKSMQEMQKLQPQMKRLQEKYKDDREALNREIMELYRRHKVNPLGGCLPMLMQMPIFIGLYNALLNAVELRHAPFAFWINDLSAPDRLPPLPHAPLLSVAGYDLRIPVLTLFMGVSMLVQQRMTPAAGDPVQQRMMMMMPLVFTVMFVNFPAGLVLYWLVNNILTIAQQAFIQRQSRPN